MTAAQVLILLLAVLGANGPFLSERSFFIFPQQGVSKPFSTRLGEMVLMYFLVGAVAAWLENRNFGSAFPQHWEFYALTVCLFIVLAFPGYVFRMLWRRREL